MARLSADAVVVVVLILTVEIIPTNQQSTGVPTTAQLVTDGVTQAATVAQTTQSIVLTTPEQTPATTEVPANTDIGPCICDLTANGCDVNCCCDPDCTTEDVGTFSQCLENTYVVEDKVCLRSTVIYTDNVQQTVDVSDPSLFCIVTDNNAERNYYTMPQAVDTVERFYELSQLYGSSSYEQPSETNTTFSDFYKSGDIIYTVYESLALGQLGLPRGLVSGLCDDTNPAAYLYDQTSTCSRRITNLERDCETQPFLSARTYYDGFKVVATPQFLQDNPLPVPVLVNLTTPIAVTTQPLQTTATDNVTTDAAIVTTAIPSATTAAQPTTLPPTTPPTTAVREPGFYDSAQLVNVMIRQPVLCRNAFGFDVDCNFTVADEVPLPFFNVSSDTCESIALEVKYIITHNATEGIDSAEVELVLGSLTSSVLSPSQTFSTSFVKLGETDAFQRSGNPGYVLGQPLMAGNLVDQEQLDGTVKQAISIGPDPSNWLTVVRSAADGSCTSDADSRQSVTFGENLRSGCTIQVSYENISDICTLIQATALNALNGNRPGYVATFGNSQPEVVGDWVEIFVDDIASNPISTEQGVCNNMYVALHIEVLYANVGALSNPQAKVIGVRYNYPDGSGQTLRYQCIGPYCQAGSESLQQRFEVSVSVEFIDASTNPNAAYAEKPAFQSKLPNDFFYPFAGNSKAIIIHVNPLLNSMIVALLCVAFV